MKAAFRLFALVLLLAGGSARAQSVTATLDQALGQPGAPLTIIEYASLTCPHCAHFHETVLPQLRKEWIDTGKVRMIYRDFPTGPLSLSVGASMIVHCAGPDRYFGVLGLLFQTQAKWAAAENPLEEITRIVRLAGMTSERVDSCLKRRDLAETIQQRADEGNKMFGVDSTPTLVIDGKVVPALEDYDELNRAIADAYAKAVKK